MSRHLLVGYASRDGSTAEVAEAVGHVLRESGASVDVLPVDDLQSIAGYDAVVLGTAIWAGKPLPEMRRFVAEQQDALGRLPVACFILCDTLKEDTPANRQVALGYAAPLRAVKEPVSLGRAIASRPLNDSGCVEHLLSSGDDGLDTEPFVQGGESGGPGCQSDRARASVSILGR